LVLILQNSNQKCEVVAERGPVDVSRLGFNGVDHLPCARLSSRVRLCRGR
jgi:hypothetical protein